VREEIMDRSLDRKVSRATEENDVGADDSAVRRRLNILFMAG